jgi:hypothetical protein
METLRVFKVSKMNNLLICDKWQNCVKFEAKSIKNAQFKAKIKEKTAIGLFGSTILSGGGGLGTNWCNRLGGGEFI